MNKLLQKKMEQQYPTTQSNDILVNRFADFFHEKISVIHQNLNVRLQSTVTPCPDEVCSTELHEFSMVSEEDVRGFALKSLRKSCNLDPLPALVIKECFDMLIQVVTQIVNLSLTLGTMLESLKLAELLPSLKKHDADHEIFQNFRPILDLPMVCKVVEKAVADQFTHHILTNHLDEPF